MASVGLAQAVRAARALLLSLFCLAALPAPMRADSCEAPVGTGSWLEVAPPVRAYHSAIYDPLRHRMIAFGGSDNWSARSEIWTLSLTGPARWTQLFPAGTAPPPRWGQSMIYDPVHDRAIVFGGFNDSTGFDDDTWTLDLSDPPAWSRLTVAGTAPRLADHTAVYAPERASMLVYGDGNVWELALSDSPTWSQLATSGTTPPGRFRHVAIYDPVSKRMIIQGGASSVTSAFDDTWSLDLSGTPTWSQLAAGPATCGAIAILDPSRNRMILHGGLGTEDAWVLSLSGTPSWSRLETAHLSHHREGHVAIYDPVRGRLIVHGGLDYDKYSGVSSFTSDTWQLDLSGVPDWTPLEAPQANPGERQIATAVYDPVRDRMIVFGGTGNTAGRTILGDTWSLAFTGTTAWTVLTPDVGPGRRYGHAAVYDPVRDRMLVFGGNAVDSTYSPRNETWALTLAGEPVWSLLHPAGPLPSPRYLFASIYDPVQDRLLVYGPDLWQLDLAGTGTWSQLNALGTPPPAGPFSHAIHDPVRDRMILFDGADTWALELRGALRWRRLTTSGTPPTPTAYGESAIYDPVRDRMVVFGGVEPPTPGDDSGRQLNSTHALDLHSLTWSQLDSCWPPPERYLHTAIYDPVRDRMVVHAGSYHNDVWALAFGGSPPVTSAPRTTPSSSLAEVAPNPGGTHLRFAFTLANDASVALEVFDLQGRHVATLARGIRSAGRHELTWSASTGNAPAPPGVYLARFAFPGGQQTRRFVVIH